MTRKPHLVHILVHITPVIQQPWQSLTDRGTDWKKVACLAAEISIVTVSVYLCYFFVRVIVFLICLVSVVQIMIAIATVTVSIPYSDIILVTVFVFKSWTAVNLVEL